MRWADVMKAAGDLAAAHPDLARIFADHIGVKGSQTIQVPSLRFWLVSDSVRELWAPCVVQWDIWCATYQDRQVAEAALRALFHADDFVTLAGVAMFTEYQDGSMLSDPDRDGFYGRAVRFLHTPLREQYAGDAPGL